MFNLQNFFDNMLEEDMETRAQFQMTLGQVIDRLSELNPETTIGLNKPHSYRGYYSDFSLCPSGNSSVGELLILCREILDTEIEGYKGGDFLMHSGVPVWAAYYGCTGKLLMSINDDGSIVTKEQTYN